MPRSLPVVANSTNHLVVLIDKAVQQHGPNCNLNYIDVSNVDDFKGVFRKWPKFNGDISKWVIHGKNADAMFETVPQEPVVATDPSHLQTLIRQTLHLNGDASDLNHIDVSDITYFTDTFKAFPTFNGDISKWSVGNADTMKCMFKGCAFNGDISNWDVSKVLTMEGMFLDSKFDGDLSRWDVSRVRNMQDMFGKSQFNQNISRWNTSDVRSMAGMFSESKFNQPIGDWDVRQVQLFGMMFAESKFNGDISNWNTASAKTMKSMFKQSLFNGDISNWNVSSVTNMQAMFYKGRFNGDLSKWDVSNVIDMFQMFAWCKPFNGNVSTWNVSKVKIMSGLFCGTQFNGDLSRWDVRNAEDLPIMFADSSFAQDISCWQVQPEANTGGMFVDNPHFLPAQSMTPWVVALHIKEKKSASHPDWNLALSEVKTIALGLGLDLGMHVSAVLDAHHRIVASLDTTCVLDAPVDPLVFESQNG